MPTPTYGYFNAAGERVPGCTTILNAISFGSSDGLLFWAAKCAKEGRDFNVLKERAGEVGSFIHDELEQRVSPDEDMPAKPPWMSDEEGAKFLLAIQEWDAWVRLNNPVISVREQQLVCEELQAGGTADLIVELDGVKYLADHKSGKSVDKKKVCCQLAFYAHLARKLVPGCEDVRQGLVLHYSVTGLKPIFLDEAQMAWGLETFKLAREVYAKLPTFPNPKAVPAKKRAPRAAKSLTKKVAP